MTDAEPSALVGGRYDLWLLEVGARKILVIKALRTLLGTGLKETLDQVNAAPLIVLENVDHERAQYAGRELSGAGASVQLVSRGDRRLIVDPRHADGNAQAVLRLLCQGELLIEERSPIGAAGRQRQQRFEAEDAAREAFEARLAEAEAAGLRVCADEGEALCALSPRDEALEAELLERPDDRETLQVYADWLQERGDRRGELIALGLALEDAKREGGRNGREARARRVTEFVATHRGALLGPLAPLHDALELAWRRGFIDGCRLPPRIDAERASAPMPLGSALVGHGLDDALLSRLAALPAALLLRELRIERRIEQTLRALGRLPTPLASLRALHLGPAGDLDDLDIGSTWIGDLRALQEAAPALERLRIRGAHLRLGRLPLPELRSFSCCVWPIDEALIAQLRRARWPKLERLELWLGEGGSDQFEYHDGEPPPARTLAPFCSGRLAFPELRELALYGTSETDTLIDALCSGELAPRLERLDLSGGKLSSDGLTRLIEHADRFEELRELGLRGALPGLRNRRRELRETFARCKVLL